MLFYRARALRRENHLYGRRCRVPGPTPASPARPRFTPLGHGSGRCHLRRFFRLEFRTSGRRVWRHALRRTHHDGDVHRPLLFHCRNFPRLPPPPPPPLLPPPFHRPPCPPTH